MSITLTCGVNEISNDSFQGRSVEQVLRDASAILNIPENPTLILNDERVTDRSTVLRAGDRLEIVKAAGEKG